MIEGSGWQPYEMTSGMDHLVAKGMDHLVAKKRPILAAVIPPLVQRLLQLQNPQMSRLLFISSLSCLMSFGEVGGFPELDVENLLFKMAYPKKQ